MASPVKQHLPAPELTRAISTSKSWDQLQGLLHAHARAMNAIHVSALMVKLAKVVASPSPQHPTIPAARPTPATATIHSMLQRGRLERLLRDVSALVSVRLEAFDARGLANTMWAVARLGFVPAHGLLQRFLFATFVHMHSMAPQEIANLAWAVATMRVATGRTWADRLAQHVLRTAADMQPQELANTAWALQQLGNAQRATQSTHSSSGASAGPPSPTTTPSNTSSSATLDSSYTLNSHVPPLSDPPSCPLHVPVPQAQALALMSAACAKLGKFRPFELMMLLLALQNSVQGSAATQGAWRILLQGAVRVLLPQLKVLSVHDVSNLACMVAWDARRQQVQLMQQTHPHARLAASRKAEGSWWGLRGQVQVQQLCNAVVADMAGRKSTFKPIVSWLCRLIAC